MEQLFHYALYQKKPERSIWSFIWTGVNAVLSKIIENDITKGYALPLPLPKEILFRIPSTSLAPLGSVDQESINERGERTKKFRMTHDQSFLRPSNHSVNERVITVLIPNYMFSFTLSRILHYIISL
jgi:hypothetical protein